jgi:outer membrane protein assembly factor BamD
MQKRGANAVLGAFFLLIFLGSCSNFRKVQKSQDWKVKYDAAMEYYEKEDYYRASVLFEEIMPIIRGLEEGEKAQFYFAYCNYYQKMYQLATHYFKSFYETYSRSQFAEEAEFMAAYSLYLDSPIYNLDQTSTKEAIDAMQLFMNKNYTSQYSNEAQSIIEEMRRKLELKAFENAKQYYKMGMYKSAIITIDNYAIDFPDAIYNEELRFIKFRAQYQLAQSSIPSKKEERYNEAVGFYQEFLQDFPDSKHLKEADRIYDNIVSALGKIERSQQLQ